MAAPWLEELSDFLRIPSVSADPAHAADVVRAAEWVCEAVRRAGGEAGVVRVVSAAAAGDERGEDARDEHHTQEHPGRMPARPAPGSQ